MSILAHWFGGYSYACGDENFLESFDSIEEAKRAFIERYKSNGRLKCHFNFVNQEPSDDYCPVVDEAAMMYLYFGSVDQYGKTLPMAEMPDRIIQFGPRGGLRVDVG